MPFGNETAEGGVQAGLAAQPLVTPADPNIVGPQAVQDLVQSFRNGFVTSQDILDRVGQVGQAKKKALLEQLGEYVNPDVIQSRLAQSQAAGAQANLQTATAQAQQGLVSPEAQLQAGNIQQQGSERFTKQAVDAWNQFNPPIYSVDETGKETDTPDYKAMARGGIGYVKASNMLSFAAQGLAAKPTTITDPKTGQPRTVYLNAMGEDVTPIAGNKAYEFYANLRRSAYETIYQTPDVDALRTPPAGASSAPSSAPSAATATVTPAPAPTPTPMAPQAQPTPEQRAQLAESYTAAGFNGPAVVSRMGDAEVQSGLEARGLVQPLNPPTPEPPAPTIAPATAPQPGPVAPNYAPFSGMATGPVPGTTIPDIRDDMQKQESYKMWQQQAKAAQSFDQTVKDIQANNAAPAGQKQPYNALDFQLGEAAVALYQPNMAIREFKWDKLTSDASSLLEKYASASQWKQIINHTGSLTPEARDRLINLGYSMIDGADAAARGPISGAVEAMKQAGSANPQSVLRGDEHRVFQGVPFGANRPAVNIYSGRPTGGGGAAPGPTVNIPGVGLVYKGADGQFYRAQ